MHTVLLFVPDFDNQLITTKKSSVIVYFKAYATFYNMLLIPRAHKLHFKDQWGIFPFVYCKLIISLLICFGVTQFYQLIPIAMDLFCILFGFIWFICLILLRQNMTVKQSPLSIILLILICYRNINYMSFFSLHVQEGKFSWAR